MNFVNFVNFVNKYRLSIFLGKCLFFQEKIYEIILKFAYIKKCLYLSFHKGTAVLEFLLKCQINLTIPKILRTFAGENNIMKQFR